jgi:hypothetical protein
MSTIVTNAAALEAANKLLDYFTTSDAKKRAISSGKTVHAEPSPMSRFESYRRSPEKEAEYERAVEAARAFPCGVAGCNGSQHERGVDPSEWMHEVVSTMFDSGAMVASVFTDQGTISADLFGAIEGQMTAAEFRVKADEYEAFPAWLRSIADRIDALAGTVTE